jgi:hypothetical protein
VRYGTYRLPTYPKTFFGIPPFLVTQFAKQVGKTAAMLFQGKSQTLRQAMNATHALGSIRGYLNKKRA